jgi:DNA-binding NarL/FixJ family response regulator
VHRIRVVLAGMPRMLRDVFSQVLADQPDMEVVGDLTDVLDLLPAAAQTRSDVAILGLRDAGFPSICARLLDQHPRIKILGVTPDGRRACLYELRPSEVPVGDVSPAGVLAAIRAAVRLDAGDRR